MLLQRRPAPVRTCAACAATCAGSSVLPRSLGSTAFTATWACTPSSSAGWAAAAACSSDRSTCESREHSGRPAAQWRRRWSAAACSGPCDWIAAQLTTSLGAARAALSPPAAPEQLIAGCLRVRLPPALRSGRRPPSSNGVDMRSPLQPAGATRAAQRGLGQTSAPAALMLESPNADVPLVHAPGGCKPPERGSGARARLPATLRSLLAPLLAINVDRDAPTVHAGLQGNGMGGGEVAAVAEARVSRTSLVPAACSPLLVNMRPSHTAAMHAALALHLPWSIMACLIWLGRHAAATPTARDGQPLLVGQGMASWVKESGTASCPHAGSGRSCGARTGAACHGRS